MYDSYPGGVGLSEKLYELHEDLLAAAKELILSCPCEAGCPSCVGPVLEVGELGKQSTIKILDIGLSEKMVESTDDSDSSNSHSTPR